MARMIPSEIYTDCPSPGEKELFRRLRDDDGSSDWVVLHSLDIVNHRSQVTGELDFVVIIPKKGVLCIEVKSCKSLRRHEGRWFYGDKDKTGDVRGPFKQASEAMFSLRQRVIKTMPALTRVPFGYCVVFTNCRFEQWSEEWHDWQFIDSAKFRQPINHSLLQIINNWRKHFAKTISFDENSDEPTNEQVNVLTNYLRPDFEFFESPKAQASRRTEELKRYTDEQYDALDAMSENNRVAFTGPAGTGKTLLAIEAARRAASHERGVLFVCFNKQLGKWLREETESLKPFVHTTTLHKQMCVIAGIDEFIKQERTDFWTEELPAKAINCLLGYDKEQPIYDELILDEAQDLLRPNYLDFLDLSLRGGLAAGRWRLFGDFQRQTIYDAATMTLDEALSSRLGNATKHNLRVNCRNTPRIATLVHLLGGLVPNYSRIRRPDDGREPSLFYYKDATHQQELLTVVLSELYREGFSASDIIVLSPRTGEASVSAQIQISPWKERLRPLATANEKQIRYSSVHAFKGLEASAVVVTDIESISNAADIFYIAITRALHRLILLINENAKEDVLKTLLQSINLDSKTH